MNQKNSDRICKICCILQLTFLWRTSLIYSGRFKSPCSTFRSCAHVEELGPFKEGTMSERLGAIPLRMPHSIAWLKAVEKHSRAPSDCNYSLFTLNTHCQVTCDQYFKALKLALRKLKQIFKRMYKHFWLRFLEYHIYFTYWHVHVLW